jgi:hypothetical protein
LQEQIAGELPPVVALEARNIGWIAADSGLPENRYSRANLFSIYNPFYLFYLSGPMTWSRLLGITTRLLEKFPGSAVWHASSIMAEA